MKRLTPEEYRALLRQDFESFVELVFQYLNPQTPYLRNWHIEVMAAKLEACRRGECRRLIINIPPRYLKSICASVAFTAWYLGHHPSGQIMNVTYAQDLSEKFARDTLAVMQAEWYQELFATRLAAPRPSAQEFATTENGFRKATSVGGVITGRGADIIIIDDPLKPDEALSDTERKKVNQWMGQTLYSRQNDKQTGVIILIMQRLHEDDLTAHVLAQEDWEHVRFPAIAEEDEEQVIQTPLYGTQRFTRRHGEALHPAREPIDKLEELKRILGEYTFASQYQQRPAPLGGGLVKEHWFKHYHDWERPEKFDWVFQSWDTANKPDELANYSVCTTWGVRAKNLYLLEVFRRQVNYPDLKRAVRELHARYKPVAVLIEDRASGTQLLQELKNDGMYAATACKPEGDKVMRLHAQTAMIEGGFVYLPASAPWLAQYLHELTTFPNSKYSDQVDSTSQALEWAKCGNFGPGMGVFYWYQQESERLKKK
jgi:predicted phage terminase large subunit-like protein